MATQVIKCKQCGKVVAADEPLIALARSGQGDSSQFITCECGEKITFWGITAQIREQNKPWYKFIHWVQRMFNKQVT
jgi:hypothetical protein